MVRAVFDHAAGLEDLARCKLGHRRRTNRLVHTAKLLAAEAAGRSLPDRLPNRNDYDGALNLMNHPAVTQPSILKPHYEATRQRMLERPGPILIISDTTELDYTGHKIAALGPIGNGSRQGIECHNCLAVDPATRDILGLTSQILHVRDSDEKIQAEREAKEAKKAKAGTKKTAKKPSRRGRRADETIPERRERENRESRLWLKGCEASGEIPAGKLWVDVCDRAADTFEFLQFEARKNRHYVIRSKHNRISIEKNGTTLEEAEEEEQSPRLLHDRLRSLPGGMRWTVDIKANNKQQARVAEVQMAWMKVQLPAPDMHKGEHDKEAIDVWAIRVWEPNPPAETKEPLEWLLLTNVEIQTDEQARERVSWYERRPMIEEFHKAQKTGMGIENLQLQTRGGLEPFIGLLSLLAVSLVNLRQVARQPEAETQPAREVVNPLWVSVLSLWLYEEERDLTVKEFYLGLAKLGGYMNRSRDAWPGWIVLWRGLTKLMHLVDYESKRRKTAKSFPEL